MLKNRNVADLYNVDLSKLYKPCSNDFDIYELIFQMTSGEDGLNAINFYIENPDIGEYLTLSTNPNTEWNNDNPYMDGTLKLSDMDRTKYELGKYLSGNLSYVDPERFDLDDIMTMFSSMTETERKIAMYLYNTQGEDALLDYFKFKSTEINQRIAFYKAS
ncbi:MAG: hypothetical protein IJY25_01010 [Bacilli bacterium]|nr:hypothetical protein [Bacilli bacterium]